jgi:quinol monooxygenase YgiN
MVTMFVKHTVTDYSNWKQVYDSIAPLRKSMGVSAATVSRDTQNPNTLIVTHQFADAAAAGAFAHSDELRTAMGKAGVAGAPEFWFGEEVERTAH